MSLDVQYVCQRAANAIISEIGPYRVSTDALQAVNQFLDNFILLLLSNSVSLNLLNIKSVVNDLLPSTLGNNAIVEAELEVKSFAKIESIDYMSNSSLTASMLRRKCFEYCTLADKSVVQPQNDSSIQPIIAVYVTTIIEHIAEYILNAITLTAEHEGIDYIRISQVFFALQNDRQLSAMFNRMDLKDKLEKRVDFAPAIKTTTTTTKTETSSFLDIHFDDLDLEYFNDVQQPQKKEPLYQPVAPTKKNRRSTFYLFKDNPDVSFSSDVKLPLMNFEELFKSGETVKVSLTPKRLKSIEVKQDLPATEHKTTSLPKLSTKNSFKPEIFTKKAISLSLPLRKLSSPRSSASNDDKNMQPAHQQRSSTDAEKLNARPSSLYQVKETRETLTNRVSIETAPYTSKSGSFIDIPRTPVVESSTTADLSPVKNKTTQDKPPSLASPVTTPSANNSPHNSLNVASLVSSSASIPSPISSDVTTPSSVLTDSKPLNTNDATIIIQEPAIPLPTQKPNTTIILRRSSVSSRKSRENLRKLKEQQQIQQQHFEQQDEPIPGPILTNEPEQLDEKETLPTNIPDQDAHTLPSSIVAKRLSTLNDDRRKSYHEECATKKYQSQQSVSVSIKQWDQINTNHVSPPVRTVNEPKRTNAVLDKVLKFERSMDDHQPFKKEKFLYLQQDPSSALVSDRKTVVKPIVRRIEGIDQAVQTDPDEEHGHIEGDEEWFLNHNEWEEQDETLIVEWLLGE